MAILQSKSDKEMQTQIKILATNLEIINQKLNQNPDAAITPGEKAIRDSVDDMTKEMEYVKNVLKSTQVNMTDTFKTEKEAIAVQVEKLSKATTTLGKYEKDFLTKLMNEIEKFNINSEKLNKNIDSYQKNLSVVLDSQKAAITKEIYQKLFKSLKKDNLIMMGFSSFLSSAIALVVLMSLLYLIK